MSAEATIDPNAMYSISIAAHLLSISPSSLRDLERRGKVECTRTLGGQRRFAGSELIRLLTPPTAGRAEKPDPAPARGARAVADSTARQVWLASTVARVQRELPAYAPADIRLRLATDLERALRHFGPDSPTSDIEPLMKSLVERATHKMNDSEAETQRRDCKVELIEHALAHLRRSLDALPTRIAGSRGSHERRHIGATLRDQLRAALAQRLGGDEGWDHIRDLVEEFVAAWYVEHAGGPRIPDAVKFLAVGVTGVAGGAVAAAALDPQIRAGAVKLKERLLSLAGEVARRMATPPPPASATGRAGEGHHRAPLPHGTLDEHARGLAAIAWAHPRGVPPGPSDVPAEPPQMGPRLEPPRLGVAPTSGARIIASPTTPSGFVVESSPSKSRFSSSLLDFRTVISPLL